MFLIAAFAFFQIGLADHYWRQHRPVGIEEEVTMHGFAADILDKYSGGAYREALRAIASRPTSGIGADVKSQFAKPTVADLEKLDAAVGATDVGREVGISVVMQHLLTYGFEIIDQNHGTTAEKVALYEWLRDLHP